MKRTHRCGEIRSSDIGKDVTLQGWAHGSRDHGGLMFIDLRDRTGLAQVVVEPENKDAFEIAKSVHYEWVLEVTGKVRRRPDVEVKDRDGKAKTVVTVNPNMPTGEVEVVVSTLTVHNKSKPLPFMIEEKKQNEAGEAGEETRLKYRYLDLRRPDAQEALFKRSRAYQAVRSHLHEQQFVEIETPYFVKYTPGGARNFLVPSRMHPGSFYALAESPQIFKQLSMVAGFDRYFQIARCFRDEDTRADRQPEFTQIDIEMSFVEEEDVMSLVEGLLARVWKDVLGLQIPTPFPRLSWADAMQRYGSDKPDTRFGLEMTDITEVVRSSGFKVFAEAVAAGGIVKALPLSAEQNKALSRKDLDDLAPVAEAFDKARVAWVRLGPEGWTGPAAKFLPDEEKAAILKATGCEPNGALLFVANAFGTANAAMSALRIHLAKKLKLIDEKAWKFLWVYKFPLFEKGDDGVLVAAHHPFTSPVIDDLHLLATNPAVVKARAYDVVLNGNELGGGSIRIHKSDVQATMFKALGISDEDAKQKFGFLLEAFEYGAPPHGGIALGMDRLAMLLAGAPNLREVLAFPKNQRAQDVMTGAPTAVSDKQLRDLSIKTTVNPDKT